MDHAACYNPEFRASKKMHDYPSRKAQLVRSIYTGEIEINEYNTGIIYSSILSRQGERWQNFGESPEDYTDILILGRASAAESGMISEELSELRSRIEENNQHLLAVDEQKNKAELSLITHSSSSEYYLFVDDQTLKYVPESIRDFAEFFKDRSIYFQNDLQTHFTGWEYFVYGMIAQGKEHLKNLIDKLNKKEINKVITLSGQSQYLLDNFADKLNIKKDFEVINILQLLDELYISEDSYLYAGSFYSRYLLYADKINSLLESGEKIKNSIENIPLFKSGPRVNQVNIWEMPIRAEYELFLFPEDMKRKIYNDALNNIAKGVQKKLIVFDPYAYHELQKQNFSGEFCYFSEFIEKR